MSFSDPPELSPQDRQQVAALLQTPFAMLAPLASEFASDPEEIWNPNAELALRETTITRADIDTDTRIIAERIYDRLAERIPGWEAHDSELVTILVDEFSTVAAEIRQEALNVPEAIFTTYGVEVLGIPIQPPETAFGWARFTAYDTRGYVVPPGLQFTLARTGDELVVFEVIEGAAIPTGSRSVFDVYFRALVPGTFGNGLSGPGDPVDPLIWVQAIDVEFPTRGGLNGQTQDEYMTELIGLLRMIALRPILPWDFAMLALRVHGVGRAVAMDGYDPSDGTWGHTRMITLILTDRDGEPCEPEIKVAVRAMLETLREVNFIVHIVDPQYVAINVTWTATAFTEQNPALVRELGNAALRDELSPAVWRLGTLSPSIRAGEVIPPPSLGVTPGRQTLRVNDLIGLLDRVRGIDFVEHDGVLINGQHDDFVLPGPTTLPRAGTIIGTVYEQ